MSTVISVEHLSKAYQLGKIGTGTFANDLKIWWAKVRGKPNPLQKIGEQGYGKRDGEMVWALKDINFTVQQGEVLGVIGHNGAGKSTLLKIISQVTAPTTGQIKVKGRIASLLEVGTGFHPELTGRENIYLNGAILGMTRTEVRCKFDEIVNFSGVETYIDTPVKRYSSGMYVRLAFAVAAHLEPEILVVDEVLAVGDASFQKKCLGKMGDVAQQGRTVLFVSHNMAAVQSLCNSSILLESGNIKCSGSTNKIISQYLFDLEKNIQPDLMQRFNGNEPSSEAWCTGIEFRNRIGEAINTVVSGEYLEILLKYNAKRENLNLRFAIGVYGATGEKLLHLGTHYSSDLSTGFPRKGIVICKIPRLPLVEGQYRVNVSLHSSSERVDHVVGAAKLNVETGDYYGTGKVPPPNQNKILIDHEWVIEVDSHLL